ncbi:hypothetical protein APS67_006533 [Streptomyces sp. AVP053U2]|nr:hypothetical protein APS67_006533 [Streptomyces sp. AVP053U2]
MARFSSRMISFLGSAGGGLPCHVVAGAGIAGHADQGDAVEGGVGRPVAAPGQAMTVRAAAGGGDRGGSAKGREGRFAPHPFGIAARGDQQLRGGVGSGTVGRPQARGVCGDLGIQGPRQRLVLGGELFDAAGQTPQRGEDRDVKSVAGRPQPGQGLGPVGALELPVFRADGLRGGDEDVTDLIERGGAGLDRRAGGVVQGAYPKDRVVLGSAVGSSGQGGAGGGVGVDRVGLAGAAAFGPVGAVDLDDLVSVGASGPGETRPVGGGAFTPIALTRPCAVRKARAAAYPAAVVANSASARRPPLSLMTATWTVSAWESAPPNTIWSVVSSATADVMLILPSQPKVGAGRVAQTGH